MSLGKKLVITTLVIGLVSGSLLGGLAGCAQPGPTPTTPAPTPEEKFVWRAECAFQPGMPDYTFWVEAMKELKEISGGRLDISVFAAGEVVPEEEIQEALRDGIIEVGNLATPYWKETLPVGAWEYLPFSQQFDSAKELLDMVHDSGLADVLEEGYNEHNMHWYGFGYCSGYPFLYSTKPVRTTDDLEGLVVRSVGDNAKALEAFGASTTYIPGGESYMALKLGTVDAAHWDNSAMFGMGWWEVTDYYITPAFNVPLVNSCAMNLDAWNSLPEDLQDMFMVAHNLYYFRLVDNATKLDREILNRQAECGYEVVTLPADEFGKIRDVAAETLWPDFAALSPRCARAIDILKDYYGIE